jgi:hypothetical protein
VQSEGHKGLQLCKQIYFLHTNHEFISIISYLLI